MFGLLTIIYHPSFITRLLHEPRMGYLAQREVNFQRDLRKPWLMVEAKTSVPALTLAMHDYQEKKDLL